MNDIKDATKSRRMKIVVFSAIAVMIIFFVGIWAFSTALSGSKKNSDKEQKAETAQTTENKEGKTEENTLSSNASENSPANQYSATEAANGNTQSAENTTAETTATPEQSNLPAPIISDNDIPTTGPTEVLLSAIMVGVVVTLLGYNLELRKANR